MASVTGGGFILELQDSALGNAAIHGEIGDRAKQEGVPGTPVGQDGIEFWAFTIHNPMAAGVR